MADITVTAANVKATSNSSAVLVQFGEAVTQGEPVYLKAADSKYWLCDNVAAASAAAVGIALTPNIADGYGFIQTTGSIDLGATLVVGTTYVVAGTAGGIAPEIDIGTTEFVSILGVASSAALLRMDISNTGIAHV